MTRFADQLFDDLMREHGAALAAPPVTAPPKRRLVTRPLLLTAGVAGLAVAATAGGLLATGGGTPAYAVTANPGGSVTLAVFRESGIVGANAKLRTLGDKQVVLVPVKAGCPSMSALPKPPVSGHASGRVTVSTPRSGDGTVTVDAHGIPAGAVLVVAVETTGKGASLGVAGLTTEPAPACVSISPIPVTDLPGGAGSSGG
jgi:hypothetical protein